MKEVRMRIGIIGSRDWEQYSEVMRMLTVFIQDAKDNDVKEIVFVHAANRGAENMVTEYIGKTEKFLKQKGFRIKESIVRGKNMTSIQKDLGVIESSLDHAIVFTTDCKRTRACAKILKEYGIPTTIIGI